jgi:hypothetical protein
MDSERIFMPTTKNGRPLLNYVARFTWLDAFGRAIKEERPVRAVNDFQAEKKARGIAAKNSWAFVSVGRV